MTAATNPSRPQRPCTTCGRSFAVPANNPGKRYCTPRCRVADWHHRHDRADGARNGVLDAVPANNGVPNAVARCPHCAQPIAVVSLLVAPAAAHIATPAAADA
jgi:endogenous inhibitor of DNA gyrase (YacG/DUF329 family)